MRICCVGWEPKMGTTQCDQVTTLSKSGKRRTMKTSDMNSQDSQWDKIWKTKATPDNKHSYGEIFMELYQLEELLVKEALTVILFVQDVKKRRNQLITALWIVFGWPKLGLAQNWELIFKPTILLISRIGLLI